MIKTEQKNFLPGKGWEMIHKAGISPQEMHLVLVFGHRQLLADPEHYQYIRKTYPHAILVMSSTAGEITDTRVSDNSLSLTALHFEHTSIQSHSIDIGEARSSFDAGCQLATAFATDDLNNLLVISDGQKVNGSELVAGLRYMLPRHVMVTGGLAGDGANFESTLVGLDAPPSEGKVVALGFYGNKLEVSHGSVGGWDPFGVERVVTRSEGNVLYELDNRPALEIYKMYLGEYARDLPGSGLLFPLSIRNESRYPLVRTILAVNGEEQSLTFAGNIPEGCSAQLMKANPDRLIGGAGEAATFSVQGLAGAPQLAILISCVGRKLLLDQRIEEEVEVVRQAYGPQTALTGFYSYGEIAPFQGKVECELHNQTMTITTFKEE